MVHAPCSAIAAHYLGYITKYGVKIAGGEGGIRTPDGLAPMPHFECGAFNHSATSPRGAWAVAGAGAHIAIVGACDKSKLDEVFFRLT